MNEKTLTYKNRVLGAGLWVFSEFVLVQIMRLAGNLILTRLLFPEAFGMMAIVYVLMTGLALFSDFGIKLSIINNPNGNQPAFLNTAWTMQILRGLLIFAAAELIALIGLPLAIGMNWVPDHSVYSDPLLPSIIAVFSISALIQGFESTKIALVERSINSKPVVQIKLISHVVSLLVMVVGAWLYHSVWVMVAGTLTSGLLLCVLSHVLLPGPSNKFQWDQVAFLEIFHFGKWMFILSIIGFFVTSGDRIILGGLVDAQLLGIYAIAFLLFSVAQMMFGTILSRVVFPAVSEVIVSSSDRLPKVYCRFQLLADLFLFALAGFIYMLGDIVVSALYDERYHDAGPMLSILAIALIGGRYSVVEQCWLATASMKYLFQSSIVRLITTLIGIPLGYELAGINGALIAIVLSYFSGWPIVLHYKFKHSLGNWKFELVGIPVFFVACTMGWSILLLF